MSTDNNDVSTGERVFISTLFGLLSVLVFFLFYCLIFDVTDSLTTYKVNHAIFKINRTFDDESNRWLVGVMDMDNIKLGSFSCSQKPINANPVLYYKMTREDIIFGNSKYSFSFSYLENCVSVSSSFPKQQIPNVQSRTQRKKGEFIL